MPKGASAVARVVSGTLTFLLSRKPVPEASLSSPNPLKREGPLWWVMLEEAKLNTAIWKRRGSKMQIAKEPLLYHLCVAAGKGQRYLSRLGEE